MKPCYLFDIDGTIADLSHRLVYINGEQKDWPAFYAVCGRDQPIKHVLDMVEELGHFKDIVLVSGRSDECREQTVRWLAGQGVGYSALYMRKEGDHRPDNLVKAELLDQILADGYAPVMAFDDRNQVVKMWRERGIPCCQVAEGNF